ncbi:MAG: YggS family pyridoxal phosphate-dependent enzyme [Bacteroidota bacterium]
MLDKIKTDLAPTRTQLVAVSKTKPTSAIQDLYDRGQRIFGENRVQEMVEKWEALPRDIEWHLIGHLQRNKVKYIAPFVSLIHSIDSLRLLKEVDKQAQRQERVIDVLLQFHISEETTKFGLELDEARALLDSEDYRAMAHIRVVGVMGMATFTDRKEQVRAEFRNLRQIFEELQQSYFDSTPHFFEISMGMSGDYLLAVEEGSTLVRIGSLLFGAR